MSIGKFGHYSKTFEIAFVLKHDAEDYSVEDLISALENKIEMMKKDPDKNNVMKQFNCIAKGVTLK